MANNFVLSKFAEDVTIYACHKGDVTHVRSGCGRCVLTFSPRHIFGDKSCQGAGCISGHGHL